MQSNQTSSRKNPSAREARLPGPRFAAGLCPLLLAFLFGVNALIKHCRQQISFGRNQVKAMMGWCGCGAYNICEAGLSAPWGNFCAPPLLPDLQRSGPVRQRSLSADLIFGYFLSRESNSLRGN
jgi:hypothetical protein